MRQEPNTIRAGPRALWVRSALGGNGLSGSGHTRSPSSATSYGVADSSGRPLTRTIA